MPLAIIIIIITIFTIKTIIYIWVITEYMCIYIFMYIHIYVYIIYKHMIDVVPYPNQNPPKHQLPYLTRAHPRQISHCGAALATFGWRSDSGLNVALDGSWLDRLNYGCIMFLDM